MKRTKLSTKEIKNVTFLISFRYTVEVAFYPRRWSQEMKQNWLQLWNYELFSRLAESFQFPTFIQFQHTTESNEQPTNHRQYHNNHFN